MSDNLETRINQGFELNPTGEKLINDYLIPWVMGQNPIWNGVVEKAIYGDSSPWEIFSDIESRWHSKMEEKGAIKYTIFAFTSLVRVRNSKRFCRRAGRGNWGGQTGPKMIENSDTGCIIGQSKMLVYEQSGKADVGVGHWIMHQYSLSEELVKKSGRANAADLVVCKITKAVKKKDKSDHNTNQSPAAIGYGDHNDAMAAQPESNGESCNLVSFAPETTEGIFNGDYQVQCAQLESNDDGSNYERFAPDTYQGFSSEYIGNNGDYQVQAAPPDSYGDGSNLARFAPDTTDGFPWENRGNDGSYQGPAVQLESYGNGSNYMGLAPDTNEGFSLANIGHDGSPPTLPESYGDNSIYATHVPNTNEGFSLANIGPDGSLPALPESYGDNFIYATHVPNTNEGFSLANIGHDCSLPALQESYGDSSIYATQVPNTNVGFSMGNIGNNGYYQEINLNAEMERCRGAISYAWAQRHQIISDARDHYNIISPTAPSSSRKRAADVDLPDDVQGGGGFKRHKGD